MSLQTLIMLYAHVYACLYLQHVAIVGGDGCPQTIPTQAIVEVCPGDQTEWIKASDRKQCDLINQNCTEKTEFQYHCLPNRFQNKLVEICAPTKVIVGQHCPYYDMQRNVIDTHYNQPCSMHTEPCANVYSSSMTHKYQECYKEIKEKRTTPALASPDSKVSLDVSDSNPMLSIGIYIIGVILVVIVILLAYLVHRFKGNQNETGSKNGETTNMLPSP